MSMNYISRRMGLSTIVLLGGLGVLPSVGAACKQEPYSDGSRLVPQDVALDMGRLAIAPSLAIGGVIREAWHDVERKTVVIRCSSGGDAFDTYLRAAQKNPVPGFVDVFPTEVAGVGIRLSRPVNAVDRAYPVTQSLPVTLNGKGVITIGGGQLRIQLVKTGALTGTGSIAPPGRFTAYYFDGDGEGLPMLTSSYRGAGTIVVNASCSVKVKDIDVNLGAVPSAMFTAIGARSISRDFEIGLRCQGDDGLNAGSQAMVTVRLDDAAGNSGTGDGVLTLSAGADTATGIGIQLMRRVNAGEVPVELGKPIEVGRLVVGGGDLALPLRAHYIQTLPGTVGPGPANGQATFTIDYR